MRQSFISPTNLSTFIIKEINPTLIFQFIYTILSQSNIFSLNFQINNLNKKEAMSKKKEKSIEQYRRDIFALKEKIKSQEQYLSELKQKYADKDILSDKSYSFSMKIKILQYTHNDIRAKLNKFADQEAYQYYLLNFAVFAFVKSCEIIGMTKEMVFRGIDHEIKGQIGWFDLSNFLREVLRLDTSFINPIMKAISTDESKPITKDRYEQFLASFMIKNEQNGEQIDNLDDSILRVVQQIIRQKIRPENIWQQKQVNIATVVYGLMNKIKLLDVLDCAACYCKCDPLKNGVINTSAITSLLKQRINDYSNFSQEGKKIKLAKN